MHRIQVKVPWLIFESGFLCHINKLNFAQSPYRNTYELPQQQPYNPPSAYASYPYQGYGAEPVVNGYAAPSYPGPGVPKQYSNLPLEQGAQSGGYPSQPSTNILAACLQRQGSKFLSFLRTEDRRVFLQ